LIRQEYVAVTAATAVAARTVNVWLPAGRVTLAGELHDCHEPPSTEQEIVACWSLTVQANFDSCEVAVAGGVDVNVSLRLAPAEGGGGGSGLGVAGGCGGAGEVPGATAPLKIVHL
jgi:hypothetical protein